MYIKINPTINCGKDAKNLQSVLTRLSTKEYCFTAHKIPSGSPISIVIKIVSPATIRLFGMRGPKSFQTGARFCHEVPKSPCTALISQFPY